MLRNIKCRLCRRAGNKLFLKGERCNSPKCPIDRKGALPPGQHGQKRARRLSDYGIQMREKQKVLRMYGVGDKQIRRYFEKAAKIKEATGKALLQLLELRLDNVVYRLHFAPSRSVARQLVNHGHILVDGKKVTIPSYQMKINQLVTLTPKALEMPVIKKAVQAKKEKIPQWLQKKAVIGKIGRFPEREEMETSFNEDLVVEFYSR